MTLFNKSVASIKETDLSALITNGESEGKEVDYKLTLPGKADSDRKEFLYDVSSFANASGGYLVYGIEETDGLPTNLLGVSGINPDEEILRLEQMARDGIRPPITGLHTAQVRLSNGNVVLVMYVPKSWNPPHQVIYQKAFRFYGRDSNGKYQLDVDELRSIFSMSAGIADKMHRFRIERVAKIVADETPTQLTPGARMVTHILPLSAFGSAVSIDLNPLERDPNGLANVIGGVNHTRYNADGFVAWRNGSYVQVFRSGILEAVHVYAEDGKLPGRDFESKLFRHIHNGMNLLHTLSTEPPIVLLVTFLGIKGWRMGVAAWYPSSALDVFDRDPLFIQEILVDKFEGHGAQTAILCRPLVDAIWNAAGWPGSPNYGKDGAWNPNP